MGRQLPSLFRFNVKIYKNNFDKHNCGLMGFLCHAILSQINGFFYQLLFLVFYTSLFCCPFKLFLQFFAMFATFSYIGYVYQNVNS